MTGGHVGGGPHIEHVGGGIHVLKVGDREITRAEYRQLDFCSDDMAIIARVNLGNSTWEKVEIVGLNGGDELVRGYTHKRTHPCTQRIGRGRTCSCGDCVWWLGVKALPHVVLFVEANAHE